MKTIIICKSMYSKIDVKNDLQMFFFTDIIRFVWAHAQKKS